MHTKRHRIIRGAGLLAAAFLFMGAGRKAENPPASPEQSKSSNATQTQTTPMEGKKFAGLVVYTDDKSPKNHYIPSGWMGDYAGIKMDQASTDSPHSGATAIKFVYKPSSPSAVRWAGVFWQDPANNWGDKDGGYDLTGANRLTFWARGAKGGEVLKEVKVGGIKGNYADSDEISIGPITLENTWKEFTINLKGRDLTAVSGGFCWATDLDSNTGGPTFFLDDIKFE